MIALNTCVDSIRRRETRTCGGVPIKGHSGFVVGNCYPERLFHGARRLLHRIALNQASFACRPPAVMVRASSLPDELFRGAGRRIDVAAAAMNQRQRHRTFRQQHDFPRAFLRVRDPRRFEPPGQP